MQIFAIFSHFWLKIRLLNTFLKKILILQIFTIFGHFWLKIDFLVYCFLVYCSILAHYIFFRFFLFFLFFLFFVFNSFFAFFAFSFFLLFFILFSVSKVPGVLLFFMLVDNALIHNTGCPKKHATKKVLYNNLYLTRLIPLSTNAWSTIYMEWTLGH